MRQYFVFNGHNSKEFGMFITQVTAFDSSSQEYEIVKIPGRTGDIFLSNERYENITLQYDFFVRGNLKEKISAIRNWLLAADQNSKLQDTYEPNFFRYATFINSLSFKVFNKENGTSSLSFSVDPRLFSIEGNKVHSFSSGGELYLPTVHKSNPIYHFVGYGEAWFTVNEEKIHIFKLENTLTCDVEKRLQYSLASGKPVNKSNTIDKSPPQLKPGYNWIGFEGGIQSMEITPRWWKS